MLPVFAHLTGCEGGRDPDDQRLTWLESGGFGDGPAAQFLTDHGPDVIDADTYGRQRVEAVKHPRRVDRDRAVCHPLPQLLEAPGGFGTEEAGIFGADRVG